MLRIVLLVSCLILSSVVFAAQSGMQVKYNSKQYELVFDKDILVAKSGDTSLKGELEKKIGDFSQWIFRVGDEKGFDVIVDKGKQRVLFLKHSLDAGGPFLIAASPDAKFVVFDYGCCTTARDFEVRNREGKVIFKNTYLENINWTAEGLVYAFPQAVPFTLNKEAQACKDTGHAWKVQMYEFNGVKNRKLTTEAKIACSN